MRLVPRWNARATVALLLLCVGILLSLEIDNGWVSGDLSDQSAAALDAPRLTMTLSRGRFVLSGTTQSAAHEARLLQAAADAFRSHDVVTDFRAGVLLPDNWQPVSQRLLQAMATMESADALMQDGKVNIRGVTADPELLAQRLNLLREAMPADAPLLDNVIVVDNKLTLDDLCRRAFKDLSALPIAFQESSAELRQSSFPSLDKVVDFAWDCQQTTIVISGHSDASGNESWNRLLSRTRAQAVADYLENNGVNPERLVVEGRGSSMPVAENDTAYGRSRNRRIEFQLRLPLF